MNDVRFWLQKSSLKVKWSVGASVAIFLTFLIFGFLQYTLISRWLLHEEAASVSQVLDDLNDRGQNIDDILSNRSLFQQVLEKDQSIRILDASGKEMLVVKSIHSTNAKVPFVPVNEKRVSLIQADDDKILVGRSPFHSPAFDGYIEVIYPLYRYEKLMRNVLFVMMIAGCVGLLLSAFLGFMMAKNFLKPLKKLSSTMQSIRKKGFHERMEPSASKDEMGELTNIFNDMMDQIEQSFRQQKRFVEDASHELRTPVQVMEGHLNLLNRWGKNDPAILEESLQASLQELRRMKKLVEELLDLSRAEESKIMENEEKADLVAVIERVVRNFKMIHENFEFTFQYDPKHDYEIRMSENHLEQVLIIVMDNAIKYSDSIAKVDIGLKIGHGTAILTIKDYGIGIPKEDLPHIFHRFYRVDKARSRAKGGNGLGLAIAKQLVEGYSGTIEADSTVGRGTEIRFVFPLYTQPKT
ncbi:HAMP domain-containing histidine kinase [Weizmannia acidilactici]|uniref:HAMP domain-containing histidine kinase n=1 Tax=Weizmannia acidilactici TaxID=2607726 RepID=UPI00124CA836|nr:HAMP domain-containing histidine kinase [Weizmannia acidilactici]GER68246.1 two-component sensor histidine kinase [Weizmannia acidilactici]GER74533.1 two-component sensor histidine kinase [Weizmannia acidilactici]